MMTRAAHHDFQRVGSTLVAALITVAVLSFLAGIFSLAMRNRSGSGLGSAAWFEARVAGESGVDFAVAEIRRVMPRTTTLPSDAWTGWRSSTNTLPSGRKIPSGVVLTRDLPALTHGGAGNNLETVTVTVEAPPELESPVGSGFQYLRLRAVGTALLPLRSAGVEAKSGASLHHFAFKTQRADIVGRPARSVARPQVSRSIEAIVRPVLPFRHALVSAGRISAGSSTIVDSFDSTDSHKSTSRLYDSAKRQANAAVYTRDDDWDFTGTIYGDAGTNGGSLEKTSAIAGNVTNSFGENLPLIRPPAWALPISIFSVPNSSSVSLTGGSSAASANYYQFNKVDGNLIIRGDPSTPTFAEVYVSGDFKGSVTVEEGATLSLYVGGNVQVKSSDLDNRSQRAANLQFYGVSIPGAGSRNFSLGLESDNVYAAIYAPGHAVSISGNGDLMGAIVAKSFSSGGNLKLHHDESMAYTAGFVIDYEVASWIEDVR